VDLIRVIDNNGWGSLFGATVLFRQSTAGVGAHSLEHDCPLRFRSLSEVDFQVGCGAAQRASLNRRWRRLRSLSVLRFSDSQPV